MTRLADRLLRGCEPARPSALYGPDEVNRLVREMALEELGADQAPEGFERHVSSELRRFRASEPVATKGFKPSDLNAAPIFVGDDVAVYTASLPLGTDITHVAASMAPPFDRFFVEFQGVPNRAGLFAWGALVTAHDYSEEWGHFDQDEGTPRWILEIETYLERDKNKPFGPAASHVAGLAEDGTWFRHSDGDVWWAGGFGSLFSPEPPPEVDKIWGDKVAQLLFPLLLTISFLHCKNVEVRQVRPPEKLSRSHRKKHGRDLVRYHVLEVEPIRRLVESRRTGEQGSLRRALHICRGHFKTFTPDAPLFGRHTGTYWWTPQVRGSRERGVVLKDYRVRAPSGFGRTYRQANEYPPDAHKEVPASKDPDSAGRGLAAHNRTQNALAERVRSLGWVPRSPARGEPDFDLAWKVKDTLFVCEVKSLTRENEERQLRIAIGQVIRYRQKLTAAGHEPVIAVVATERKPADESWDELCADEGIFLVWPEVSEARLDAASQRSV